jgi:hypothetical protein
MCKNLTNLLFYTWLYCSRKYIGWLQLSKVCKLLWRCCEECLVPAVSKLVRCRYINALAPSLACGCNRFCRNILSGEWHCHTHRRCRQGQTSRLHTLCKLPSAGFCVFSLKWKFSCVTRRLCGYVVCRPMIFCLPIHDLFFIGNRLKFCMWNTLTRYEIQE